MKAAAKTTIRDLRASVLSPALNAGRVFESGASRNSDEGKFDYEGFYSPLVMTRFGEYMNKHRHMEDGTLRASDNWQKGIPLTELMKSGWRHFMDWFSAHRGFTSREGLEDAICGLLFNAQAYLHAKLLERGYMAQLADSTQ